MIGNLLMIIAENSFYQSIIVTQLLQSLQFQLLIVHPCLRQTGYKKSQRVPLSIFFWRCETFFKKNSAVEENTLKL